MAVMFEYDFDKALAALVYLASRTDADVTEFDKYKAAKLLFLADKYHLVRYGRPIIGDCYRALPYGPIPQKTLDILSAFLESGEKTGEDESEEIRRLSESLSINRRFNHPRFSAKGAIDLDNLSKSDLMALDHIIALHGRKSFSELKALTHSMAAYEKAWNTKPQDVNAADMSYEDFFEEEPDAMAGALEEMLENNQLSQAFPER